MSNERPSQRLKSSVLAVLFALIAVMGVVLTLSKYGGDTETETADPQRTDRVVTNGRETEGKQTEKMPTGVAEEYLNRNDHYSRGIVRTILLSAVFVVFLLVGFGIYRRRYRGGSTFGTRIDVIGKKYVGPKQYLMMIEVEDRRLLLGITDQSINFLYEFEAPEDVDQDKDNPRRSENEPVSFPAILRQRLGLKKERMGKPR